MVIFIYFYKNDIPINHNNTTIAIAQAPKMTIIANMIFSIAVILITFNVD